MPQALMELVEVERLGQVVDASKSQSARHEQAWRTICGRSDLVAARAARSGGFVDRPRLRRDSIRDIEAMAQRAL